MKGEPGSEAHQEKDYGSVPASAGPCGCVVLEQLTQARAVGFTAYLAARHLLAASAAGRAGHQEALQGFEAARKAFRRNQRQWEQHVAEHHLA